jgi:hypothetical protein
MTLKTFHKWSNEYDIEELKKYFYCITYRDSSNIIELQGEIKKVKITGNNKYNVDENKYHNYEYKNIRICLTD